MTWEKLLRVAPLIFMLWYWCKYMHHFFKKSNYKYLLRLTPMPHNFKWMWEELFIQTQTDWLTISVCNFQLFGYVSISRCTKHVRITQTSLYMLYSKVHICQFYGFQHYSYLVNFEYDSPANVSAVSDDWVLIRYRFLDQQWLLIIMHPNIYFDKLLLNL